jgi:hypothetical protein
LESIGNTGEVTGRCTLFNLPLNHSRRELWSHTQARIAGGDRGIEPRSYYLKSPLATVPFQIVDPIEQRNIGAERCFSVRNFHSDK